MVPILLKSNFFVITWPILLWPLVRPNVEMYRLKSRFRTTKREEGAKKGGQAGRRREGRKERNIDEKLSRSL